LPGRARYAVLLFALCLGGLAIAPALSVASTFGSDLTGTPNYFCSEGVGFSCAVATKTHTGGTAEGGSPLTGVLVSVRLRHMGPATPVTVRVLRATGTLNTFHNVAPEMALAAPASSDPAGVVTQISTRRPIVMGDLLGIGYPNEVARFYWGATGGSGACYFRDATSGTHPPETDRTYNESGCGAEVLIQGTVEPDADSDGFGDGSQDNCPGAPNPGQEDLDGDGQGDACDGDIDGDGVANASDAFPRDRSESADSDRDGIGDAADTDDDNDGLPDLQEATLGTSRTDLDSDDDGVRDDAEVNTTHTSPTRFDTDKDRLSDGLELGKTRPVAAGPGAVKGTDPARFRRDRDRKSKTNPRRRDTDRDGLADGREDRNRNGRRDRRETDPRKRDTDGDHVSDKRDRAPLNKRRH
jgi:hypothetical protein